MQVPLRHQIVDDYRHGRKRQDRHVQQEQVKQPLVVAHNQNRQVDQRQYDHQRRGQVAGQAEELFKLGAQGQARVAPHAAQQLHADLDDAFGPALLL